MNAEKSQALELRIQGLRRRPSQKRFDEQLQTLKTNGGKSLTKRICHEIESNGNYRTGKENNQSEQFTARVQ